MRPLDLGHKDHLDIRYEDNYQRMEGSLKYGFTEGKRWHPAVFICLVVGVYHWYSMNVAVLVCLVCIFLALYNSLTEISVSARMIDLRLKELNWRIKELQDSPDEKGLWS